MSKLLYCLFEHATGYAMFKAKEVEDIGLLLPQVQENIKNGDSFKSLVKLVAFSPFKTALNALENINSLSEGMLTPDLRTFLESNVPAGKKSACILGVSDSKLAQSISEELSLNCQYTGVVPEINRGLRKFFPTYVKDLTPQNEIKAQLGLGHSYSRAKVKFNVNKADNMIIQSIALLDQLDKDINTFCMRLREWYSYHFPELIKVVPDHSIFVKVVQLVGDKKLLDDDKLEELEEIIGDSAKASAVIDAARASMGMDISPVDLINIQLFTKKVISLVEFRKRIFAYLTNRVETVAPNLSALIGEIVSARLISHAGSLTNLAKYPASTVQILGAEKALFRALKKKGNTPKYGLIFHSSFIGRAGIKNKGRISRYLANKCSIASRIDSFSEIPTNVFGAHLKQQVEDRLKFYESGELPPKNVDVMKEAVEESDVARAVIVKKEKKRAKKAKKRATGELDDTQEGDTTVEVETPVSKKKAKKDATDTPVITNGNGVSPKKRKDSSMCEEADPVVEKSAKKAKKRKSKVQDDE